MNNQINEEIDKLKKEKKYEEIYYKYGSKAYTEVVPQKYAKKDIKQLKKEGRYEDIYNKYGEIAYSNILEDAQYNEIKQTQGKFKAILWKTFHKIKIFGVSSLLSAAIFSGEITAIGSITTKQRIEDNAVKYENEIEEYDKKIADYAEEIKSKNFSDIQIFMKVMNDMWHGIKGYKTPDIDAIGFLELDLATEEGYGVCRNMACDVAKKLNKINPEYNARTMAVDMGEDGYYKVANIERNVVEENNTIQNENKDNQSPKVKEKEDNNKTEQVKKQPTQEPTDESTENKEDFFDKLTLIAGNHLVTLVDVKEDNVTLVLDPTNPGIGVYRNGKITMFNSPKENSKLLVPKEYAEAVALRGGLEGIKSTANDYINSFRKPNISDEEMEIKYGLNSQNKAIEETKTYLTQTLNIKFKNRIKVDEKKIEKALDNNEDITIEMTDLEK